MITLCVAAVAAQPATAADVAVFDPETVDVADVIGCKICADDYIGFIMTITLDNEPGSYQARGWQKRSSANPWMTQYHLPAPITLFGYTTSEVAFTASAMLAIIDLADPLSLATTYNIDNILPGSGRFMGERQISHSSTVDSKAGFAIDQSIAITLPTVETHPGKTLIGCSYQLDLQPLAK
jgi:hypothetical protein